MNSYKASLKKIIILTGSELRHTFFRVSIAQNKNISVLASFCEGEENSLQNLVQRDPSASKQLVQHAKRRSDSEKKFFVEKASKNDLSRPTFIKKGSINDSSVVKKIFELKPDLIICYGSSLIKSRLLEDFKGSFINVHLGLSPYYRGSGTNVWPLINEAPEYVGATFMHIDSGIDTGNIIHQIRADVKISDSPHDIGNRLIHKMTEVYQSIILDFDRLKKMPQPVKSNGKLYLIKDFNNAACKTLYKNFTSNMLKDYLVNKEKRDGDVQIIENPCLESSE